MRSSWPGNWIMPDERTRCQVEVARWKLPTDVTTVLVTRLWHGTNEPPGGIEERVRLLKRYTAPSVLGQVAAPDRWVILLGKRWIPGAGAAAGRWLSELPDWVRLVAMNDGEAIISGTRRGIDDMDLKRRIVVARCDGDDMLAPDFFQALLAYFGASGIKRPTLLEFPVGVQTDGQVGRLDVRTGGHFHAVVQPSSLKLIGPYVDAHTEVWRRDATLPAAAMITRWPMWCEVIHDGNAVNRLREGPMLALGWAERFGFGED